jgi:hypothetical protein
MKCWYIRNLNLRPDHSHLDKPITQLADYAEKLKNVRDDWFVKAHRKIINSLHICESFKTDIFIVTASSDWNI